MSACAANDRIMQTLRVQVPGATDALLELQLFNVMDEFFRRTSAWTYLSDVDLVDERLEYDLATPVDTTIVRVMWVMHNSLPVPSTASAEGAVQTSIGRIDASQVFPDGDAAIDPFASDITGSAFTYAIYRPGYIQVTGLPDESARQYPMKVTMALTLSRSCLECECDSWAVEDWMWEMFFDVWLDGTLGRCYAMPAKPWSSPIHAQYHGKRFRNAMAYRKQEAIRGFLWNQPMWRFPRSW